MTHIYRTHSRPLMRFLLGLTNGELHAAEDLVQETMLRAWQHVDDLQADSSTRNWLFTVGRHLAVDSIRRRRVRPSEVDLAYAENRPSTDDTMASALVAQVVPGVWRSLTPAQRALLTDLHINGHSPGQVAEKLGTPVGTVKSRAHYALRTVREAVLSDGDDRERTPRSWLAAA